MLRTIRRSGVAAGALLLALGACGKPPAVEPPRLVLLYAPCSVNRSFLEPWDARVPYTPSLAALADEGVVFLRHETEAGQSGTDFAALFTGSQADRHGVYCHPKRLDPGVYQVSEAFAQAGYDTFFWSGQAMGSWALGYGQGVAREHVFVHRGMQDLDGRTANDERFAAILERLRREPGYKAFVQVNFTLSHSPYHHGLTDAMLDAFAERYPEAAAGVTREELARFQALLDGNGEQNRLDLQWDFEDAVARLGLSAEDVRRLDRAQRLAYAVKLELLDRQLGKLLDTIRASGLLDRSLIAFTADHGEVFHRESALFHWTHGGQLAPEVLGIPLIVRAPGLGVRPGVYEAVTRSIDVFPTLCGLAGVPLPPGAPVDGVDLSAALRGEAPPPRLVAFSHTTLLEGNHLELHAHDPLGEVFYPRPDPALLWVRARDGDLVCQHRSLDGERWVHQVFDLAADPELTRDLFDPANPEHARLVAALARYKALLVAGHARARGEELPQDEALEELRSLGYAARD